MDETLITISDKFVFSKPFEVIERFITCIKPEKHNGTVKIDSVNMEYDENELLCEIHTDTYRTHTGEEKAVFYIDFKSVEKQTKTEIFFKILF